MLKRITCLLLLAVGLSNVLYSQSRGNLDLIPRPARILATAGAFTFTSQSKVYSTPRFKEVATLFASATGLSPITSSSGKPALHSIVFGIADKLGLRDSAGYQLKITPDHVFILALTRAGALNGMQSLLQLRLLQPVPTVIPCAEITDYPRFGYRGVHLDVSRNFFSTSYIKRFIDLMALYKMNTFHWHLTDGAGWRLEIKRYPELTRIAAWRDKASWKEWWNGNRHYALEGDPNAYGGYYTQEEAREIVAYAAQRGITVIPEIEMPGHSEEVLAVYPQLSCSGSPYKNSEFCLGNDSTFHFLENVLKEVMDIFPSPYIHIGGDEADKKAWKQCPKCQQRIRQEHLKDENELQSYAIRRMEKFLVAHQRKLLGWDEILEGGLAPEATVMSWRGEAGGIAAASAGHDVIMTPGGYCYFDSYQADPTTQPEAIGGYLPLEKVYSYEPVPEELTPAAAQHVLGAQATTWTEYIPNTDHLEYMIYPRLLALSEVVWSDTLHKEWTDFQRRLQSHYRLLQRLHVNYYRPSYAVTIHPAINIAAHKTVISFSTEQYQPQIRYTLDGTLPTSQSALYTSPFEIHGTATVTAAVFKDNNMPGKPASLQLDDHLALGKKVIYNLPYSKGYPAQRESTLVNGYRGSLTYGDGQWQGFEGKDMDVTIDMDQVTALKSLSVSFMQQTGPGVYIPAFVEVLVSDDNKDFRKVKQIDNDIPVTQSTLTFKDFRFDLKEQLARYIRIHAKNQQHGFLFADEVIIY
ncbi:family 20 glycosylhydrolase [Chitinophaga polysaccharea]|uniref:glycoside hydrolase family 20 protein n=1 Tax=Chitinophaga polysaccharea TaxID=1293035 RepID=UPI0014552BC5|nr:family 20 glycosylhydrolase [Chitinophaga polysaccharea]NLR60151.1 family 20 glycosylhydrolase [Chitinophaga polysaccharea]